MTHLQVLFRRKGWSFVAAAAFAAGIALATTAPRAAQTASDPAQPAPGTVAVSTKPGAASALWRTYLWESFPSERLSGLQPDIVSEAYQKNDWRPFFVDSRFQLNDNAQLLLHRLGSLEEQAVDPKPFQLDKLAEGLEKLHRHRALLHAADPAAEDTVADRLAEQDVPSAQAAGGPKEGNASVSPQAARDGAASAPERLRKYYDTFRAASEVDIKLAIAFFQYSREMNPYSGDAQMQAITGETPMETFLLGLQPASPHYQVLVSAYARYRKLAALGIQQPFTRTTTLRPGESGNHVRELQKRLQQEDFYFGKITGTYDGDTVRAAKDFQAAHLLDQDGAIGRRTQDWLNTPFREKADMIAYSLKAMRNSQTRAFKRFIRINIPQFLLEYHKDGEIRETHRVVVGKATGKKVRFRGRMVGENQTPTLNSAIEQVILNPRWYVSDRIRLELSVEAKSDPTYFERHGYVEMSTLYPWGQPRIFQRPGPKNALGRVKFEFPNAYAVYLHDTPLKHLFQRPHRDFSHGCIRVDKAIELAQTLLNDDKNPYAQKVDSILTKDRQTFVRLAEPVPIMIEYIPASSDGRGRVLFPGDPYDLLKEDGNARAEKSVSRKPRREEAQQLLNFKMLSFPQESFAG